MTRRTMRAAAALAVALLAGTSYLGTVASSIAGPFDEARPLANPLHLSPEIPWHLPPACQVIVKSRVVPMSGVTQDDVWYCELPYFASRRPSDPCSCVLSVDGARFLRNGMVVWRPRSWRYLVPLQP